MTFEVKDVELKPNPLKRLDSIEIAVTIKRAEGTVYVTDLMLQPGRRATMWHGHPSEMKWSAES